MNEDRKNELFICNGLENGADDGAQGAKSATRENLSTHVAYVGTNSCDQKLVDVLKKQ